MITTQETTVNVSGLTTVEFDRRYRFYSVRNDGSSPVQVSTVNADCVAGADGVVTVPKDSSFVIANCGDTFNGTMLYLNGNGTVTVVGQYSDNNRFKVAGKGGDGGLKTGGITFSGMIFPIYAVGELIEIADTEVVG